MKRIILSVSTRALLGVICVLGSVVVLKALSIYYDFDLLSVLASN